MRLRSISNAVVTLATAGSLVTSSPAPHNHGHAHVDKRTVKTVDVDVPGPIVIAYELNGKLIDQSEVCEGIQAGTLKWADGTDTPPECFSSAKVVLEPATTAAKALSFEPTTLVTASVAEPASTKPSSSVTVTTDTSAAPNTTPLPELPNAFDKEAVKVSPTPTWQISSKPASTSTEVAPSQTKASSPASSSIPSGQGLESEFPDGTIDCATFPSEYGPIEVEWTGLGGWSGIQYITMKGNEVTHIDTAVAGGDGCKPGAMCSYACPPGYQKSQWPSTQGSTGQSVGGVSCNSDGKLALTNPSLSKNLCIQGTGAVIVQNKLSNNAAICRTDYPGTEDEVVPLNTQPDSTNPLTCPDAATYFQHDGDATSAQYYINNQGVALQSACTWGTDGTDMGNWAPSYLGVGQDINGKTWLSISSTAQNNPSSYKPLNFTVKIVGDTSGNCGLSNGKYCSGNNYDDCNELGCTASISMLFEYIGMLTVVSSGRADERASYLRLGRWFKSIKLNIDFANKASIRQS